MTAIDPNLDSQPDDAAPDEVYVLDALETAQLLGVSRTRLSQLTSRGVFSFHRRKIGTRNRLFYRREEILNYLHQQSGRRGASASYETYAPPAATHHQTLSTSASPVPARDGPSAQPSPFVQRLQATAVRRDNQEPSRNLTTAAALRERDRREQSLSELIVRIEGVEKILNSHAARHDRISLSMAELTRLAREVSNTRQSLAPGSSAKNQTIVGTLPFRLSHDPTQATHATTAKRRTRADTIRASARRSARRVFR